MVCDQGVCGGWPYFSFQAHPRPNRYDCSSPGECPTHSALSWFTGCVASTLAYGVVGIAPAITVVARAVSCVYSPTRRVIEYEIMHDRDPNGPLSRRRSRLTVAGVTLIVCVVVAEVLHSAGMTLSAAHVTEIACGGLVFLVTNGVSWHHTPKVN